MTTWNQTSGRLSKITLAILLATTTVSLANAQQTSSTEEKEPTYENIVVTGTSKGRTIADTPSAVTVIDETTIANSGLMSQADALRAIPSIKVEGGGGEVATNLFVRGLPSGGQFQFTPLEYDGLPVFSTFGLNSSAFDVYYRNDLGIERAEFVSGGASNLFGPGSVAGIINYISKKGADTPEHTIQVEMAEDGRMRADFFTSGPLAAEQDLYYALSGFYRYDEGPLDTGLPTEGYQIRGNLVKEFADGSGSLTIYTQMIDDAVQFYLPIPLDGSSQSRIAGNDGNEVESVQTVHAAEASFATVDGIYQSPIRDGVKTVGGTFGIELEKELTSDGLMLNVKSKYSDYEHQFNLFLDGDGMDNTVVTQQQYLTNRGITDPASFTWADSGQAVPADYLLFGNRVLDRNRPATDFTLEVNLSNSFYNGDTEHFVTVGSYFSRAEAGDFNVIYGYLAEFNNVPRLIDLSYTDSSGQVVNYTQNGLTDSGIGYTNKFLDVTKTAFYITDQIDTGDWTFDIGARWESIDGSNRAEGSQVYSLSDDPSLAPNLQASRWGNGDFTQLDVDTSEVAISGAALYRWTDNANLYGYLSRGFFFPEVRSVRPDPINGGAAPYEPEIITLAELGVKFFGRNYNGTAALFYNSLDDRQVVEFVNDGNGGLVQEIIGQSTETMGVELTGSYTLTDSITLNANVTYQDHEFTQYDANPAYEGNELRRKPKVTANFALQYDDGEFDASLQHSYYGDAYANDSNSIKLDAYHLFSAYLGYTWSLANEQSMRVGLNAFNLFDGDGITEGSPRLGAGQTVADYFIGRPVLPRRIGVSLRYDF